MKKLIALGADLAWSATGLIMMAASVLSFPFFMVALMRGLEFKWWSAMIAGVLIHAIPILGTIAYLIGATYGGYHVVSSGFDWDAAAHPMSQQRLAAFKSQARPELIKMCKSEPVLIERSSMSRFDLNTFCPCYADRLLDVGKLEDASSGRTPEVELAVMKAQNECMARSRR